MRSLRGLFATFLLGVTLFTPAEAQRRGGRPGEFDYYLLTLSWSPEFCYSHRDNAECTGPKHYGFIVHGLWPQNLDGTYPEHCSNQPGLANPAAAEDVMPDPGLVEHEWSTHGTCSGLSADAYFALIHRTFQSFTIPQQFVQPSRSFTVRPAEVKQAFSDVNQGLPSASITVDCNRGYLTGIQICLTRDGHPTPCPASSMRDCRTGTIRVPPVR